MMLTKLLVTGMSCKHCKQSIEDSLLELEGVNRAEAHYTDGFVEVDYEEALITVERIAAEIDDLGFEVKLN